MGNSLKKVLSLVMIALLVITSTPAMTFAESELSVSNVTAEINSATAELTGKTKGSTIDLSVSPSPSKDPKLDKKMIIMNGLEANTTYTLTVKETIKAKTKTAFVVTKEKSTYYYINDNEKLPAPKDKVYHKKNDEKTYYYDTELITSKTLPVITFTTKPMTYSMTTNSIGSGSITVTPSPGPYVAGSTVKLTAVPMFGYQFDSWTGTSLTGPIINVLMDGNKTISAKFTSIPVPLHNLSLVVGTGGIAFENGHEKAAGTYQLTYAVGSKIIISTYANAGYSGGVSEWEYIVNGSVNETINVDFTSVSQVYGLDFYQTDGYFSGYKPDGSDDISHNPMNDMLSATVLATPSNSAPKLGDTVSVALDVTVLDGDLSNGRLNEIDFYQDGKDKQTFKDSSVKNPVAFSYKVPSAESDLLTVGFVMGTPTSTHKVYTKVLSYDLVDRYHSNFAAAILATTNTTITVEVPLPEYTVTFDAKDGLPAPGSKDIISGGKVDVPTNPTKDGFTFNYWTLNDVEYNFDAEVTGNITLVAKYTAKEVPVSTFTVTFDAKDGLPAPGSKDIISGGKVDVPTNPTKDGFTFNYWTLNDVEYNFDAEVTGNITLVAKYTATDKPIETQPENPSEVVTPPTTEEEDNYVYITIIPTTEASIETLLPEEVALGEAKIVDFDSFQANLAQETTEVVGEVVEITTEAIPLADALPKTGQLPVEIFYGIGGLISAAGVFLKRKK